MAGTAIITEVAPHVQGFAELVFQEIRNIVTDLETLRGVAPGDLVNELRTDMGTVATFQAEVDTDLDAMNDYLAYLGEQDGVVGGEYRFTAGANAAVLLDGTVHYRIGGVRYSAKLPVSAALVGTTTVTGTNFRAWRVVIDRLGAVTTESVDDAGQATEEPALLHLGSVAQAANTAVLGYFTVEATGGFTPATDNIGGETSFTAYELFGPPNEYSALTAALGAATSLGTGVATISTGTVDAKTMGLNVAQIAADATLAFTDADTITTTEAGGWLVCTDLAGTGLLTISSDGVPGATALTDTDAATALVALNLLASRLPAIFVPIAYITVVTANAATFTAGTTNFDATDVTSVVTDQTFGVFDRTATAATVLARQSNPPAVPATLTAPAVVAPTESAGSGTVAASGLVTRSITRR
jgi:hypothetical protein